jgi:hypothetical protein
MHVVCRDNGISCAKNLDLDQIFLNNFCIIYANIHVATLKFYIIYADNWLICAHISNRSKQNINNVCWYWHNLPQKFVLDGSLGPVLYSFWQLWFIRYCNKLECLQLSVTPTLVGYIKVRQEPTWFEPIVGL